MQYFLFWTYLSNSENTFFSANTNFFLLSQSQTFFWQFLFPFLYIRRKRDFSKTVILKEKEQKWKNKKIVQFCKVIFMPCNFNVKSSVVTRCWCLQLTNKNCLILKLKCLLWLHKFILKKRNSNVASKCRKLGVALAKCMACYRLSPTANRPATTAVTVNFFSIFFRFSTVASSQHTFSIVSSSQKIHRMFFCNILWMTFCKNTIKLYCWGSQTHRV